MNDPSLVATFAHPKLGRLLFFDPTDEVTPFGRIRGALQSNYGLLVGPDASEMVRLPRQEPALNGITRVGKMALEADGTLYGEVVESRIGDRAAVLTRDQHGEADRPTRLASSLTVSRPSLRRIERIFRSISMPALCRPLIRAL